MNSSSPIQTGLQEGALTWFKVASLGVAIAVSGNFSGWNYGLGIAGLGGMFLAAVAMSIMFFCLTQCVAELAAALTSDSGLDGYTRSVLGPTAGYVCGMSIAVALAIGSGLALSFIEAYAQSAVGIGGWQIKVALMVAVIALQLRGAKDAVFLTMLTGLVALTVLAVFCLYGLAHFRVANWMTVGPQQVPTLFPAGLLGVLQCIPYALFLFLGVEQAAQAAPEMKDMTRSLPKALITAIGIIATIGLTVLVLAVGAGGVDRLAPSNDPLLTVVEANPQSAAYGFMRNLVGIGALFSLIATFFSLFYASSRQFYQLARAGDLPDWFARVNKHHAPTSSLGIAAVIGLVAATAFPPEDVMVVFIFLLASSYVLLASSFIRLRRSRAELARPYRAIGGEAAAWTACVLALIVMASCYGLQVRALSYAIGVVALLAVYFHWLRKPQLTPNSEAERRTP